MHLLLKSELKIWYGNWRRKMFQLVLRKREIELEFEEDRIPRNKKKLIDDKSRESRKFYW